MISSVTRPFCRDCTRARLSADGQALHVPVRRRRARLRGPCCATAPTTTALAAFLAGIWSGRDDRYSELRSRATPDADLPKVEMFAMGG